jgi:hypothetical protein
MGKLPELLLAWAPFVAVVVLWVVVRRGYGRLANESLEIQRASIELQKRMVACLEDIRASANTMNRG